jgi:hypothetical protein
MAKGASASSSEIRDIVSHFVGQLSSLIEQDAVSRAREAILSAFGADGSLAASGLSLGRRRGRPPGRRAGTAVAISGGVGRKRRKAPIQLCPVPGCTNRAAPVFGMVCAKHKDLSKTEIRKYREARRAQRSQQKKTPAKAASRRAARPSRAPRQAAPKAAAPKPVVKPAAPAA